MAVARKPPADPLMYSQLGRTRSRLKMFQMAAGSEGAGLIDVTPAHALPNSWPVNDYEFVVNDELVEVLAELERSEVVYARSVTCSTPWRMPQAVAIELAVEKRSRQLTPDDWAKWHQRLEAEGWLGIGLDLEPRRPWWYRKRARDGRWV
jgi:hypothetical protein